AALASFAKAEGVADFYKGRNVSMIIGYSVGGGYDAYALGALYWQAHSGRAFDRATANDRRGQLACRQLHFFGCAERWLGAGHVLAQHGNWAAPRPGRVRQPKIYLAWQHD